MSYVKISPNGLQYIGRGSNSCRPDQIHNWICWTIRKEKRIIAWMFESENSIWKTIILRNIHRKFIPECDCRKQLLIGRYRTNFSFFHSILFFSAGVYLPKSHTSCYAISLWLFALEKFDLNIELRRVSCCYVDNRFAFICRMERNH